jgi:hypothetical protein
MSQRIYENYLGILGMMEMWVASQPKANRVIPLIEKGIFPRKRILGLVHDGNDKVLGWFRGWQATREEESRVIPPGFKTSKPQTIKSKPKSKEKEMGKIQGVTTLPRVDEIPSLFSYKYSPYGTI